MTTNKKHTAMMRVPVLLIFLMALSLCHPMMAATQKTVLIINAHDENDPWVNEMIQPIMLHVATIPDITSELCNLNIALRRDSTEYKNVIENTISKYTSEPPEYVVMVGTQAFDMRDEIKEAWGDVPMLLITSNKDFATMHDFFNTHLMSPEFEPKHMLQLERDKYNFTAIIIPEFYKETVDMMVGMLPKMQELVFISDSMFVNRRMALGVNNYLHEQYPNIKFSWLKANQANAEILQGYMANYEPDKGLLMSTWLYEQTSVNGIGVPTSNELKMITGSRTPIFSLRESYIPLGVVGGVYADLKLAITREIEVLDMMFAGEDLSKVPFYTDEDSYPCVNYRMLTKFGMKESACPEGTVFYSKPESFLTKYLWQILGIIMGLLVVLSYLVMKNHTQQKKIAAFNRNREFVNAMPVAYSTATIRYDSQGDVVTIDYAVKNEAFNRIIEDNMVVGSPYLLFPANYIAPKVTQLIKDHKTQVFTYHFPTTDTYYQFIICLVNNPIDIKGKNISQIDLFAIDMTERYKMEMQIIKTKRKLDITLNVSNLIPWQFDIKKDIITYDHYTRSTKFEKAMDISNTEMSMAFGKFIDMVHPDDRQSLIKLRNDMRSGLIKEFNLRYRRISGDGSQTIDWCEMTGTLTELDKDGMPQTATGSIEFITERIEQQHKMSQALERANESDRMKSAFLANMSHEIRTPLNAIVGFSNVIAYTQDEQERLKFCDIINKNNDQLLTLINDVLDLAKIESNTVDINYVECDVNDILDQIESTMANDVPQGVSFKAIKGCNECLARLDPVRVKQILSNLISNSCKFTSSGNITFGYELNDNDRLYFFVRDSGKGISKEDQEKIFNRFVKLDSFKPGTGLGLSICNTLVDKMGGEIGVESAGEGKGSLFWFVLPYIPASTASDISDDGSFIKQRFSQEMLHNYNLKILIAEDNDSNYKLLDHLLEHFNTMRAANGREAVELFVKFQPDVILMDITMPQMDGYEAFDRIRSLSKDVPIIAVTANVYDSDRRHILSHGFNAYVSKPITQKAIIDAIGHALIGDKHQNQQ